MKIEQCMLTTIDNPFDPFENFREWFLFDISKGYNCCGKVERIARRREDATEKEDLLETERAIDVIIKNHFLNIYKKISKETAIER